VGGTGRLKLVIIEDVRLASFNMNHVPYINLGPGGHQGHLCSLVSALIDNVQRKGADSHAKRR
jgi:hypothetical protein